MSSRTPFTAGDLRKPTDYKRKAEIAENRVRCLSRRVVALELERDALKYRLEALSAKLEAECKRRGITLVANQAKLELGA